MVGQERKIKARDRVVRHAATAVFCCEISADTHRISEGKCFAEVLVETRVGGDFFRNHLKRCRVILLIIFWEVERLWQTISINGVPR